MKLHEFVDESITRRLLDNSKDVVPVSRYEFDHVLGSVDILVNNMMKRTNIPGMSDEDLKSLYAMKVHQVLRRGLYDRTKNPRTFFYLVFTNLNRDINRLVEIGRRQQLDEDGYDHSFSVDTTEKEIYADQPELHPLDVAFEKLEKRHQEIVRITLTLLERDNPTLVPLAARILDFWL